MVHMILRHPVLLLALFFIEHIKIQGGRPGKWDVRGIQSMSVRSFPIILIITDKDLLQYDSCRNCNN